MELVIISGPGAVGAALGVSLIQLGFDVRYVGRRGPQAIDCSVDLGSATIALQRPKPSEAELKAAVGAFFAVKAYDLVRAVHLLAPSLEARVPLIPLCNGAVETELDMLAMRFPNANLRKGFTTFGVSVEAARRFKVQSQDGRWIWGPREALSITPWEQALTLASSRFVWRDDIAFFQRKKWLFNTVANTLAGAYQWPRNGLLLQDNTLLGLVFAEAYELGLELWGARGFGGSGRKGEAKAEQDHLWRELLAILRDTADNENSMVRDLRLGRRTETDYLAGLAVGRSGFQRLKALHSAILASRII